MRIGIDIDGVLTDFETYWTERATKYLYEHGREVKYFHCYDLDIAFGFRKSKESIWEDSERDAYNKFMDELFIDYDKHCHVRYTAKEVVDKLKELGHEIVIVTRRHHSYHWFNSDDARNKVKSFLDNNGIAYDYILFAEKNKKDDCEALKIDVMLDDNPYVFDELRETGVTTVCFSTNYNEDKEYADYRVYSWYEFLYLIENM